MSRLDANVRNLLRGKPLWVAAALTVSPVVGFGTALAMVAARPLQDFGEMAYLWVALLVTVPLFGAGYLWLFAAAAVRETWIGSRAPAELVAWFCLLSLVLFVSGVIFSSGSYHELPWFLAGMASALFGFLGCAIPFGRFVRRSRDGSGVPD